MTKEQLEAELITCRAEQARLQEEIARLRADRPLDQSIPAGFAEMAKQSAVMLAELDSRRASFVNNLEAELYSCMAHAYQRGRAQVSTLTAALRRIVEYVQHKPTCPQFIVVKLDFGPGWVSSSQSQPCTCGLDAAVLRVRDE